MKKRSGVTRQGDATHPKLQHRTPLRRRRAFSAKCESEGLTQTDVLNLLIQGYVDGDIQVWAAGEHPQPTEEKA